jgi:hypothetical protein
MTRSAAKRFRALSLELFARSPARQTGIVDGAGADDDHQSVVGAVQHTCGWPGVPSIGGTVPRRFDSGRKLAQHMGRWRKFLDFLDADVVDFVFHDVAIALKRQSLPETPGQPAAIAVPGLDSEAMLMA